MFSCEEHNVFWLFLSARRATNEPEQRAHQQHECGPASEEHEEKYFIEQDRLCGRGDPPPTEPGEHRTDGQAGTERQRRVMVDNQLKAILGLRIIFLKSYNPNLNVAFDYEVRSLAK